MQENELVLCKPLSSITFIRCILLVVGLNSVAFAFKPEKEYTRTPDEFGLTYESISFATSDNYKLNGWFFPAESDSPAPAVVISEGDAGNMSYYITYAYHFQQKGYNVLLYDYRGFGESQPFEINPEMLTYTEFLKDVNAAIDYVKTRETVNGNQIVLMGFSMGAGLTIGVASQREDVVALIVDGIWSSTKEVTQHLNARYKIQNEKTRVIRPKDYPIEAEPINAAATLNNTALCIITGSLDTNTPPQMAYQVYSACKSPVKTLWFAAKSPHGHVSSMYRESYIDFIFAFLNQVFP